MLNANVGLKKRARGIMMLVSDYDRQQRVDL